MKKICYLVFLFSFFSFSQKKINLNSPDGKIQFQFELKKDAPYYRIMFGNQLLIDDSALGLIFKDAELQKNLQLGKPEYQEVDTTYKLVVGKTSEARNHYKEVTLPLTVKDRKMVNIVVRVFNDGVGFRYEFPEQDWKSYELTDEKTSFNISGNPTVYSMFWGSYDSSHEALYHIMPFNEIPKDTLMDMPGMFNFSDKAYLSITEANLRDYAGMYLKKKEGYLETQLSPLPGQEEVKVKAKLPHHTPWRVILIGDRPGKLIESNIITSLNEPSKIDDTSWIKPGKTSFHWWNGDIVPDTTFAPGINFKTNKYYIDFCAKNNIPYHAVIGYGGMAWYKSDASGYSVVGPATDLTQPVASLEMQKICDYAKEKGVFINVWVHWQALYPQLEEAFAQFEEWGIKGMMVDFINRDDQEMVNIMEEILESAARHKLYIQFHGSFKPTGLHRTYPNELTREGTYNYEQNKWQKKPITPEHDLNVVFTRMLAGASDYHLGGFRAVLPENFKIQYTRPLTIGTRSHMMAMYVVLESYLSMVADYPEAYEGEPGFDFVSEVPTIWDETVVPEAKLQSHVVIARRKDDNWYIGSINNSEKKSVSFSFDFLKEGQTYKATIYGDDAETDSNPNHIKIEEKTFQKGDKFQFEMASGGGLVIKLEPVN
ncbi:glycoside hydrolase family 97 protein [Gramella sp. AN32]|uniref:Glycoside hydrolase family 97 protein n=1 Tax=Christiangramia antarctica TaxID=2058158 RepID=A0ABW5WZT0_9FLAO|nr:glycoside hydrolase family 97 protein [Gramella sp. AN32]MCM4155706.1 glycoside hydrolase [Gramella sp. AN32]